MRLLFFVLVFFISVNFLAQNERKDTLIVLENYSVLYSQRYLQPLTIEYEVICPIENKKRRECSRKFTYYRCDNIKTSRPEHYNYNELDIDSIWDKGHMAPRQSLACNCESVQETFSFLNCALQHKDLNRYGVWRDLEDVELELAKTNNVSVLIEVSYTDTSNFLADALIPSGFFKTIVLDGDSVKYFFPNVTPESLFLEDYKID
jgi:DNA/RNA endonuclease G (NUC1)